MADDKKLIFAEDEIPTERQLNYARDLGIIIESGATRMEVSDMISAKVDKDKIATDRHLGFANYYNIECTKHIGKKALFNKIHADLVARGEKKDIISWFTYRVYRNIVHGGNDGPIDHPRHRVIQEIAASLVNHDTIIKSIQKYDGEKLIWFGSYTSPGGNIYYGGSNRTTAYKLASSALHQRLDLEKYSKTDKKPPKFGNIQNNYNKKSDIPNQALGCGVMIIAAIFLTIIIRACS